MTENETDSLLRNLVLKRLEQVETEMKDLSKSTGTKLSEIASCIHELRTEMTSTYSELNQVIKMQHIESLKEKIIEDERRHHLELARLSKVDKSQDSALAVTSDRVNLLYSIGIPIAVGVLVNIAIIVAKMIFSIP